MTIAPTRAETSSTDGPTAGDRHAAVPALNPARIMDLSWGIARTGTLTAALDLGVFDHLADGPRDAVSVARQADADLAAMERLLTALAALGLLEIDASNPGPTYRLAPDAAAYLVTGRRTYIGDLRHMHHVLNYRLWPDLAATIQRGRPTVDLFGEDGSSVWTEVTPYLDQLADIAATWLCQALAPGLGTQGRVLDVGCGSGAYSRLLARTSQDVRVTAIDREDVVALAARRADDAGLAGRVELVAGDLRDVSWTSGNREYDLVLFANLLHGYDEPECIDLLRRARSVLAPGGRVAVFELVPEQEDPMANPVSAFFSLQMLMTSGGRAYTAAEYERLFLSAGLRATGRVRCPVGPQTLLMAQNDNDSEEEG